MTTRTTETVVTFARPFRISGHDRELPAGSYRVETDETLIEGLSFHAYRREATLLRLPAVSDLGGRMELLPVDPQDLDDALARDRSAS
ncbi:hypothetical protein P2H44_22370 [Albimonas sp. CAU 1670]|uniref:hypothetical protein n=1 Tax=Albimonas sp. CAU 1670 TaxID=3032599 RepID=UPI0023DB124E|nr:hypothetical protein [Albimonas sp. CAU 1670]MDF2235313.1 hypothetical protein [Albimonas sp. CAU 1670]